MGFLLRRHCEEPPPSRGHATRRSNPATRYPARKRCRKSVHLLKRSCPRLPQYWIASSAPLSRGLLAMTADLLPKISKTIHQTKQYFDIKLFT